MTPDMINELQNVSQQHLDNLVGNVFAALDKLKADIQAESRSRPDADLLINNSEPFMYFEFLAVACYRMRGKWKRANEALKTLEKRRTDWNVVITAALIHTQSDLAKHEKGSEDYERELERVIKLIDLLAQTFRPVAGPNAQWVAITAATVGVDRQ